jgi:hypothetical protein
MKKLLFIFIFLFCTLKIFSQTFKSTFTIEEERKTKSKMIERVITITDKKITITKYIGETNPQILTVNKIEEKEDAFDGKCKYYYCTTVDKDPINGYQKAIVIKKQREIVIGLFATEIDVYISHFGI